MARIRLLTWNIWMMPRWTLQSPQNGSRAAAIAQELLQSDFDVLCLEKAFDGGARTVMRRILEARYPYQYGPVNASAPGLIKINGGVWVLSRTPLVTYREIKFDRAVGIEKASSKGAMFLTGKIGGQTFQLIATHLQGESGPRYTPGHQLIRDAQMRQIATQLIAPFADPALPLFICGDFCTPRRNEEAPSQESNAYQAMLSLFNAENGPEERVTLDDNRSRNELAIDNGGRMAELDYILLRRGARPVTGRWERIIFRRAGWDGPHGRKDLSYRYAVGATFDLEEGM